MRRLLFLAALGVAGLHAQHLSVGILGGAPFTDVVSAYNTQTLSVVPTSSNFVVGPSVQVNLPLSLRVEADALYRPYSFSASNFPAPVSGSDWNFPILLQYRFNTPLVKPFVEGGVAFDHLANLSAAAKAIPSGTGQLLRQSNAGVVLGGGIDVKIPFVRISAELRYTHQGSPDFQQISNLNQAEFLLGVHF